MKVENNSQSGNDISNSGGGIYLCSLGGISSVSASGSKSGILSSISAPWLNVNNYLHPTSMIGKIFCTEMLNNLTKGDQ